MKTLYKYWMIFAKKLAVIPTTIILSLVYYVVISVIAVINFILGKDLLNKRFRDEPSFWLEKENIPADYQRCKRQF